MRGEDGVVGFLQSSSLGLGVVTVRGRPPGAMHIFARYVCPCTLALAWRFGGKGIIGTTREGACGAEDAGRIQSI